MAVVDARILVQTAVRPGYAVATVAAAVVVVVGETHRREASAAPKRSGRIAVRIAAGLGNERDPGRGRGRVQILQGLLAACESLVVRRPCCGHRSGSRALAACSSGPKTSRDDCRERQIGL